MLRESQLSIVSSFLGSPAAYSRWQWRGWSDILQPYYTMTQLWVSTSCHRHPASQWPPARPQQRRRGLLVLDAPQTCADAACASVDKQHDQVRQYNQHDQTHLHRCKFVVGKFTMMTLTLEQLNPMARVQRNQ